jgi:hypothetical protein
MRFSRKDPNSSFSKIDGDPKVIPHLLGVQSRLGLGMLGFPMIECGADDTQPRTDWRDR